MPGPRSSAECSLCTPAILITAQFFRAMLSSPLRRSETVRKCGTPSSRHEHPRHADHQQDAEEDRAEYAPELPEIVGGEISASIIDRTRTCAVGRNLAHNPKAQAQEQRILGHRDSRDR